MCIFSSFLFLISSVILYFNYRLLSEINMDGWMDRWMTQVSRNCRLVESLQLIISIKAQEVSSTGRSRRPKYAETSETELG